MGSPVRVEVYSDVVCPWCYIGKRRFEAALAAVGPDAADAVEVALRPFQLDPRAPRGPGTPLNDVYARKFGGPERAAQMIDRVTATAAGEGLEFHLDRAVRANTADAHRLLWWALRTGGSAMQWALDEELMHAYFTEGADLGDHDVLVSRAKRCGLDEAQARRMLAEEEGLEALAVSLSRATDLGITAVPTFVINGSWCIPGAQDSEYFVRVLQRLV